MKNVLIAGVFVACSALMVSCGDDHSAHADHVDHDAHADHTDHGSEPSGAGLEAMSLDGSKKWKMDEHTRDSFSAMALSYASKEYGSMDAAALMEVGNELQGDIVGLIQGCTMDGDAHNQLHIFLTGYMAAVDALALNGGEEDAKHVGHYLEGYSAYFE